MDDMTKGEIHTTLEYMQPGKLIRLKFNTNDQYGCIELAGRLKKMTPEYIVVQVAYISPYLTQMSGKLIIVSTDNILQIGPLAHDSKGRCTYGEPDEPNDCCTRTSGVKQGGAKPPAKKSAYIRLVPLTNVQCGRFWKLKGVERHGKADRI